ncbi:MAG: hypothetical protein IJN08_00475 [Clostridia bacterium]|nr:hypothetical protein [Clostridia bacterium]
MTESEMIKRAKIYMEKLAMGINPLNDSPVPEGELINNVRLSRCFAFTAQMLERMTVTENEPAKKKSPLFLDYDKRNQFEYSTVPIPVSEISRRLNDLITDERMLRLSSSQITSWLSELELMCSEATPDGKYSRYPTARGKEIGIFVKERTGTQGPYKVVLYNLEAQKFILDNLDSLIDMRNMRAEKRKQPWSANEDELLKSLVDSKLPLIDITAQLRRSRASVRKRIAELGLDTPSGNTSGK